MAERWLQVQEFESDRAPEDALAWLITMRDQIKVDNIVGTRDFVTVYYFVASEPAPRPAPITGLTAWAQGDYPA